MLSQESIEKIEVELSKYPADKRQAAVMGALRIVQTEHGWLSPECISDVAKYLRIPEIAALTRDAPTCDKVAFGNCKDGRHDHCACMDRTAFERVVEILTVRGGAVDEGGAGGT